MVLSCKRVVSYTRGAGGRVAIITIIIPLIATIYTCRQQTFVYIQFNTAHAHYIVYTGCGHFLV